MLFIGRVDDMCAHHTLLLPSSDNWANRFYTAKEPCCARSPPEEPFRIGCRSLSKSVFSQTLFSIVHGFVFVTDTPPPRSHTKPRSVCYTLYTHIILVGVRCLTITLYADRERPWGSSLARPISYACILHKRRALISLMDRLAHTIHTPASPVEPSGGFPDRSPPHPIGGIVPRTDFNSPQLPVF